MKKYLYGILRFSAFFSLMFSMNFSGQILFSNPITGTNPSTANPYIDGQTVAANITVSGIGRGSGISANNANDRYNASGWNSTSLDANDYFEFTLTPNPGLKINFSGFAYTSQASGTGPVSFAIRSSLDSFTSDLGTPSAAGATISLSAPMFQNVTAAITFRVYGWGASAAGGTFSINDFAFNGTALSTVKKPEPSGFPSSFSCSTSNSNSILLSWADAAGTIPPDGYLVKWSSTSYSAITDPVDGNPVVNGAGVQNVSQGIQNFLSSSLAPATTYYFKIWSYTNSGSDIDYKLIGEPQASCTTLEAPCNFLEDFTNLPTNNSGSYQDRSWTGIGGTWTATDARTDQNINGRAITVRSGVVESPVFGNGLATITFKTKFPFEESAGNLTVKVNNMVVATLLASEMPSDNSSIEKSFSDLNIPGNIILTLESNGARYTIDDLQWTCFTGTPQPNITIQGNSITIPNGDLTPTTSDGTDFGTMIGGTDVERTFEIRNAGSATLNLTSPSVTLLSGAQGFTISAQPAAASVNAFSNSSFKVKFNSTVPGTHTETVQIASDDPDTPLYTFQVKAVVTQPVINIDKTSLTGFSYAFAQGPSALQSFKVNGNNLAAAITVSASANWEISTNQAYDNNNVAPWTTVVLSKNQSGAVSDKTIYVRLKDGLPVGTYTGTVTLSSTSAVDKTVSLTGSVTPGLAKIKVLGNGSSIANGSSTPSGLNNTLFATQNIGNSQTKSFEILNLGGAPLTINSVSISGADATAFSVAGAPPLNTTLSQNQSVSFSIIFKPTSIGTKNATVTITNNDQASNPFTFALRGGAVYCSSPGEIIIAQQDFETLPSDNELIFTKENIGAIPPGNSSNFSSGKSGSNDAPKVNNLFSHGSRGYRIQGADPVGETASGIRFTFGPVNTSAYTDVSVSLKVAGFSLGSKSNGMDSKNQDPGPDILDADKIDFVLVEISPDGGVNWYPQAKIVSNEMNVAWSFNSESTGNGTRLYQSNQNLTYFKSSEAGTKYSALEITGIPQVNALLVRVTAQNNAVNESWIIDDIRITSTGLKPKIWNGASWLPSAPQPTDRAVIDGIFETAANADLQVCQCEINSSGKLIVKENTSFTVTDFIINDGEIIVESGAGLVQLNDGGVNSGTGTFTAERKINLSVPIPPQTDRNQYNFLISPVEGVNLKNGIYSGISAPHVLYHNQSNNHFYESTGAYIPGRALAVKEPGFSLVPNTVSEVKAVFKGVPVNGISVGGTPLTFNAVNSAPGVTSPPALVRGYNLIGNPYPSNIDLVAFYNLNGGDSSGLSSTFYFWDSTANNRYAQEGSGYDGLAYAQFNAVSLTPTKAQGDPGTSTQLVPTRYVPMAQGFMARVYPASKTLVFSNSIRTANSGTGFFGKSEPAMNRFWLNMVSPGGLSSNIAVVYFEEGNNGFAADDSTLMGGSDVVYTFAGTEKVSINGRSEFSDTDMVVLGSTHFAAGQYKLALDKTEGIFANGQHIFLKDTVTGSLTDLSENPYVFDAENGETEGRFQIVYREDRVLSAEVADAGILLYREGESYWLKSTKDISEVEIYDLSGKLTGRLKPNSRSVRIDVQELARGVYILKIVRSGEIISRKIVK